MTAHCRTCGEAFDTFPAAVETVDCPCPAFCAASRQANEWWATIPDNHPLRDGPIGRLPKGWRHMSEPELWHRLQREHERRRR